MSKNTNKTIEENIINKKIHNANKDKAVLERKLKNIDYYIGDLKQ